MQLGTGTRRATDPKPNPVPIMITINPGIGLSASPNPATLRLGNDEEALWDCTNAATQQKENFKVIFKAESPFFQRVFHQGDSHSGRPRPEIAPPPAGTTYSYAVEAGGLRLDPDVIVRP